MKNVIHIIGKCLCLVAKILLKIPFLNNTRDLSKEELLGQLSCFSPYHDIYSECTFSKIEKTEQYDLSIIIPFYNAPKEYMRDCLESLINQKTKYTYEIICINDGSIDNTLQMLEEYASKYSVIKIINQKNQGISMARNAGINHSRGKYIGFIDQDDWVESDYIESLLSVADEQKADIVKCSFDVVRDGKIVEQNHVRDGIVSGYIGNQVFNYSGMIWSGIYQKKMFDNIRFPEKFWYEDMITRFLVYRKSNMFVSVQKVLYFKRKHESNASVKIWKDNNFKSLDQVYLVSQLLIQNDKMGLPRDITLLKLALEELSLLMNWRMKGIKNNIRYKAFLMACEYVKDYEELYFLLDKEDIVLMDIFIKRNYLSWFLYSWGTWAINR